MIFALRSAVYLVLLIIFWFGLGRALCRWLTAGDGTKAGRHALHGFALATLTATLGYRWGVPLSWIFRGLAGLSLVGCVLQGRQTFAPRSAAVGPPRPNDLLLLIAGGILLFAPLAIGGLQFSLIHSNQYDLLNYLQSAVVRLTYTHREISTAGPAEFMQNPLLVVAHRIASSRPAIVDSYALTDGLAPGNLYQFVPAYLTGILLLAIPATAGLAQRLGASQRRAEFIGLAVIGGFWGQYIVDCDAWSLIGALPLALTVYGVLDGLLDPASPRRPPALGLAVPSAAFLLVYPEQFCFLAPAVGAAVFLRLRQGRLSGVHRTLVMAFTGTLLLAAPGSAELWTFVEGQLHSTLHANHTPLTWTWAVLFGATPQTAPIWLTGWQTLAGLFGIYLPWLNHATAGGLDPGLILGGALGLGVVLAALGAARRALTQPATRAGTLHLLTLAALLLTQTLALGLLTDPWPAAKALSYSFPWIMLLAFLPLAAPANGPMLRWPARLLLSLQLALAFWRPVAAADKNGAGYPEPYPAADLALKVHRRWDTNDAPRLLATSRRVRIDVPDLWLEYYAMICMQAQGRAFVKTTPVREYYDMTPKTFGQQDVTAETDGLIFAEFDRHANALALGFSTGREIRWSGARPFTITRVSGPARLESWLGLLSWWDSARVEIQADAAGPAVLELLLRRHPALADPARPVVTIEINGQPAQTLVIGPIKTDIRQLSVIPLNLTAGQNFVTIKTDAPAGAPAIGFSNPRLTLPPPAAHPPGP